MRRFLLPASALLLSLFVVSTYLHAEDAPRAPRSARRAARRAARQAERVARNQRGLAGGLNSAGRHAVPTPHLAAQELVFDESEMTVVTSNQFLPLPIWNLTDSSRLQQFLAPSPSSLLVVPTATDQGQATEPSPFMGYWLSPTSNELNWSYVPVEICQSRLPGIPYRTSFAPHRYVVKLRNDVFPATTEPEPIAVAGNIIQSEEFLPPSPQRNSADPSTSSLQLGMKPVVAADAPACRPIVPQGSPAGDVLSRVVVAGELAGVVLPEPGRLDPSILQMSFNQLPVAVSGAIVFAEETPPPLPPREKTTLSERAAYDVWKDAEPGCVFTLDKTQSTEFSEEERRVWAALDQPVSLHFEQARLEEIFRHIANSQGINIVVDEIGLTEAGVTSMDPVSINVEGVTLSAALGQLLDARDLAWLVQDEVLKITSRQRSEGELFTQVYSVADLIRAVARIDGPDSDDHDSATSVTREDPGFDYVTGLIRTFVQPDSWNESGGPAAMVPHAGSRSLVVRQTRRGHQELAVLLGCVRQIIKDVESLHAEAESSTPESGIRQTSYESNGESAGKGAEPDVAAGVLTIHPQSDRPLTQPCSVHFDEAPLQDVLRHLADHYGLSFSVDVARLAAADVTLEAPVTVIVDGIELRSVLNLVLMPLNLEFKYSEGTVRITACDRQIGQLTTRIYQVADLLYFNGPPLQHESGNRQKHVSLNPDWLIGLITSTVDPSAWVEFGGRGNIVADEATFTLVVRQTARVHQELADLLAQLRQLRDVEVLLEMSAIRISRDDIARIKTAWGAEWYGNRVEAVPDQIERLRSLLDRVDKTVVVRPGKITMYEGQTWRVTATDEGDSSFAYLTAISSAGRRSVDCNIAVPRQIDGKQMLQRVSVFTTNVGNTCVINASEASPVIEQIPFSTGCFARFGAIRELAPGDGDGVVWDESDDGVTLVFITPRIIVREEERLSAQPRLSETQPAGPHQTPAVITVTPRIIIQEEEEELLDAPAASPADEPQPDKHGAQSKAHSDVLPDSFDVFGFPTHDLLFQEEEPPQFQWLILQSP